MYYGESIKKNHGAKDRLLTRMNQPLLVLVAGLSGTTQPEDTEPEGLAS